MAPKLPLPTFLPRRPPSTWYPPMSMSMSEFACSLCCRSQQPNEADTTVFLQGHQTPLELVPRRQFQQLSRDSAVKHEHGGCGRVTAPHLHNGCHVLWQANVVAPTWPSVAGALTPEPDNERTLNKTGRASPARPSTSSTKPTEKTLSEMLRICL